MAVLEKFDNLHDFERMCADILNASGYRDVVLIAPRGGSDGGKDILFTTELGERGLACVTLRKDIEAKFEEDFSKRKPSEFDLYILFCTAYLTSSQKLKFTQYCLDILRAKFVPKDIETLRSLLDSTLLSIREKYVYPVAHLSWPPVSSQQKIEATQGATIQDVVQFINTGSVMGDLHVGNRAYTQSNKEEYNLHIHLSQDSPRNLDGSRGNTTLLAFSIGNGGSASSSIKSVGLVAVIDGESRTVICEISRRIFPTNYLLKEESPLRPGDGRTYLVNAPSLSAQLQACGETIVLKEAYVEDEIGNKYSTPISDDLAIWLLNFPRAKKYPYSLL